MLERVVFCAFMGLFTRHFDFPQCSFQYPTINICASPHYFNKYLWSRIVSGIFAWDWKADFRSLKFTQDLEIRRFKFKFRIPVLVWLRPGFQIKFIQDLDSSLSLSRWFWRNRTLKLSRSLCSSGQWISNWRPEFFLQKLTTAKTVSDSGWLGLFFLSQKLSVWIEEV